MITGLVGAVLCIAAWLLLIRGARRSVARPGVTVNAALVGVALVLLTPAASATVGVALRQLSGRWNLEDLLSHILLLIAAGLTCAKLAGRLNGPGVARSVRLWVEIPVTLTIPTLTALFLGGQAASRYYFDLFHAVTGVRVTIYWVLLTVLMAWLLIYGALAALVLEEAPPVAYITAAAIGVIACAAQLILALTGNRHSVVVWALVGLSVVAFAVASSHSPIGNSSQE